ncbi:hypothetical protein EW146_g10198 [Bondarzewia mesenterica]|uniref:Uncharacterized protein n=1 Tax=Bondarzewia mesenterica TaxID=1095465 RepID=A0A4S4L027_9AGAM|nr:hypothetical protein EW146_g10198 [Bondarzewia mesenterica]
MVPAPSSSTCRLAPSPTPRTTRERPRLPAGPRLPSGPRHRPAPQNESVRVPSTPSLPSDRADSPKPSLTARLSSSSQHLPTYSASGSSPSSSPQLSPTRSSSTVPSTKTLTPIRGPITRIQSDNASLGPSPSPAWKQASTTSLARTYTNLSAPPASSSLVPRGPAPPIASSIIAPSVIAPSLLASSFASTTSSAIRPVQKQTFLPTSPPISFTPPSLPYKPLTLDAAQWTFSSHELQRLVSSAIRESATEKFIRLLPPDVVEGKLVEDLERVNSERARAGEMALRSGSAQDAPAVPQRRRTDVRRVVQAGQQCLGAAGAHGADRADSAQLVHLRDMHRASALAVALRKLNASYARRTRDLGNSKERVGQLEAELEEAWKTAEEVAVEVDKTKAEVEKMREELERVRLEAKERDEQRTEIGVQVELEWEEISDRKGKGRARYLEDELETTEVEAQRAVDGDETEQDESWEETTVDGVSVIDMASVRHAEVIGVMGTAVVSKARLTMVASDDEADSRAARRRSTASQVSRVSAARKRSMRASKASLRIPRDRERGSADRGDGRSATSLSRGRSASPSGSRIAMPPVPSLPMSPIEMDDGLRIDEDGPTSFLEMEPRQVEGDDSGEEQVEQARAAADEEQEASGAF